MSEAQTCKQCGTALNADSPEGLCPRCLMALNLQAPTEAPTGEVGPEGTKVVPPPPEPPPLVNEIAAQFPHLEILECLGRGGMGVVYKARQPKLDRLVALKVLAREKAGDARFAERFQREARALARLSHPNIVAVYDFGETGGLYYLLMEFVDGVNLRQLIRGGSVSPEQALTIVPPLCEALQYAHQQGIVHRDIKPENILVDKLGRVKIADFGIAKMLGTAGPAEPLTAEQQAIGTPHYMAPEQLEKPQTVDHRADIYSLGVVFYEMLTGELPLGKFQPPSRKVQVDVRLDEVVLHALEKEPERRYQQASQVKTDVETITRDEGRGTKSQPGQDGATPPPLTASVGAGVWQQVKGPAIGLMATGVLIWLAVPVLLYMSARMAPGRPHASLFFVPLTALVVGGILFTAGLLMRRLTAYRLAVGAAGLAILTAPVSLLGLPIGLWALVVLLRREVRQAFDRGLPLPPSPMPSPSGWGWKLALVLGGVVLLVLAIPVGAILLSMVVPAVHRASTRPAAPTMHMANPSVVIEGTVTDAVSGQPIARARVADYYGGGHRVHQTRATWTDSVGHYRLATTAEAHTRAVSAPGYETALTNFSATVAAALVRLALTPVELNAQLQPITNGLVAVTTAEAALVAATRAAHPFVAPADVQRGVAAWHRGDYPQALALLLPAAEQGDPVAQHRLGVMYVRGDGVVRDLAAATEWFRQAAWQGQGESQYSLGLRYQDGESVSRDEQEAVRWFRQAAEQGVGMAASRLGQCYFIGRGVRQDYSEAYKWLSIAGENVEPGVVTVTLRELRRRMSPEQVAQAEASARDFVPKRLAPADP